jgi:hypothetical protein
MMSPAAETPLVAYLTEACQAFLHFWNQSRHVSPSTTQY